MAKIRETPDAGPGPAGDDVVMRVLIVEDEDTIAVPLAEGLEREGFEVARAANGAEALAAAEPDIVLLDLRLPDMDGLDVCRRLRERSRVPIIIVTARGEEADRVVGLELGADDYVVKPFGLRELIARIRAVTRRSEEPRQHAAPLRVGGLEVDERARRAFADGNELDLTPMEFELLAALARDPGAAVSRRRLLAGGLGHELERLLEDDRRSRRGAPAQARRSRLDRDGPRHRLPPPVDVTRRLVLGYLGLTLFVLLALEVPLGIQNSRTERGNLEAKVQHDATNLASIAQDALETGSKAQLTAVAAIAYRYSSTTGGRVLVVGRNGVAVVDTRPDRDRAGGVRLAARDIRGAARTGRAGRAPLLDAAPEPALRRRAGRRRRRRPTAPFGSPIRRRRSTPGSPATG